MVVIHDEASLYGLIKRVVEEGWDSSERLVFEGYPILDLTLRGERFDGSIPMRLMLALQHLQSAVDGVAREVTGRRRLRDVETRRRTEIIMRVNKGSTNLVADIAEILSALAGQMTDNQVWAILVLAGVLGGCQFIRSWLADRQRVAHDRDQAQLGRELVQLGMEQMQLVQKLVDRTPVNSAARRTVESGMKAADEIVQQMAATDELVVNGEVLLTGEEGRRLPKVPRGQSAESLEEEGDYLILSLRAGSVPGSGLQAKVRRIDNDEKLSVTIPATLASDRVLDSLRNKRPLRLRLRVTRSSKRPPKAEVVGVERIPGGGARGR